MQEMTKEQKDKCSGIIHTASVAAGGVGITPIPCADTPVLIGIQITMIVALAKVFDISMSTAHAKALAETQLAAQMGKLAAGQLAKLIPGIGSLINAGIASAFTETLGWGVAKQFHKEYLLQNNLL